MEESEFLEEVRAEGRKEGRMEAQRDDILGALEVRFGAEIKPEFASRLADIADLARLGQLHRLAIKCRRLDDFRKQLS